MGSKITEGVRFAAYTDDHDPPHLHCFYAGTEVILELFFAEKKVRLARRDDAIRPMNTKRSDLRHIRKVAKNNVELLLELWKGAGA